jgi:hypothetical protein
VSSFLDDTTAPSTSVRNYLLSVCLTEETYLQANNYFSFPLLIQVCEQEKLNVCYGIAVSA